MDASPTFEGVFAARERIASYGVTNTPLRSWPALTRLVGTDVWVKHENHLPTGAFKVRGGINLGAAALAAALKMTPELSGRKVALICSGGNVTIDQLRSLLR